jgi:hypothetical protein
MKPWSVTRKSGKQTKEPTSSKAWNRPPQAAVYGDQVPAPMSMFQVVL